MKRLARESSSRDQPWVQASVLLTGAVAMKDVLAQTAVRLFQSTANFNGTPIPGGPGVTSGSTAYFVVKGLDPQQQTTISFVSMPITFTANGTPFVVPVPAASHHIQYRTSLLTTTDFVAGGWSHECALIGPGR